MSIRLTTRSPRSFFALVILLIGMLPMAAFSADRSRLVAFMEVTGFDVSLSSMRKSASNAPMMLGLSEEQFGLEWSRLADEIFDPQQMNDEALDILEQTLRDAALEQAAAFYASPLGQKLVAAENESHMTDGEIKDAQGGEIAAQLMRDNPERIGLYQALSDTVGSADTAIRNIREVQVSFIMAAIAAGVVEAQLNEQELRTQLASSDEELRQSIRAGSISGNAYTYRNFSDDEIRAYISALSDPLMQEVYELMTAVEFTIMLDRYEDLAKGMAKLSPSEAI